MTEGLIVERVDDIVTITLNQPAKKNAINESMWLGLLDNFRDLRRDPNARVVVITGAGDGFCSGADVSAFLGNESETAERPPHPLMAMRRTKDIALALHELPMPTIAKVNGVAAGAGCNLALGCDLIVASDRARFSEIFSRRALSLDFGGAWVLPRLIGLHRAKELAFFGDILSAQEVQDFGLVNRVVPHDELRLPREVVEDAHERAAAVVQVDHGHALEDRVRRDELKAQDPTAELVVGIVHEPVRVQVHVVLGHDQDQALGRVVARTAARRREIRVPARRRGAVEQERQVRVRRHVVQGADGTQEESDVGVGLERLLTRRPALRDPGRVRVEVERQNVRKEQQLAEQPRPPRTRPRAA